MIRTDEMLMKRYEYRHKITEYAYNNKIPQIIVDRIHEQVKLRWGSGKKYLHPNSRREYDLFMRRKDQIEYVMLLRYHAKRSGIEHLVGETYMG